MRDVEVVRMVVVLSTTLGCWREVWGFSQGHGVERFGMLVL